MKVKLNQRMAGPSGNFAAGEVVDLPQETAFALIESHQALPVKEAPAIEKAAVSVEETAELPAKKAEKEAVKAAKKAEKEAVKAAKKAEKEAVKA